MRVLPLVAALVAATPLGLAVAAPLPPVDYFHGPATLWNGFEGGAECLAFVVTGGIQVAIPSQPGGVATFRFSGQTPYGPCNVVRACTVSTAGPAGWTGSCTNGWVRGPFEIRPLGDGKFAFEHDARGPNFSTMGVDAPSLAHTNLAPA